MDHAARPEQRQRVRRYVDGLLSPVERTNGWQLVEQASETRPYGMHRLLAGVEWEADAVRDDLVAYPLEQLGDPRPVVVIDEPAFSTRGRSPWGQAPGPAARLGASRTVRLAYCLSTPRRRSMYSLTASPTRPASGTMPTSVAGRRGL